MPFVANSFVDGPAGGTPITAATLNNLEQGVVAADITTPGSAAALALDGLVAGYVGTSSATRTAADARYAGQNVQASIIHVAPAGSDASDGLTWKTAKATLAGAAAALSANGGEIQLGYGTITESVATSFNVPVKIVGRGSGIAAPQRPTVLSYPAGVSGPTFLSLAQQSTLVDVTVLGAGGAAAIGLLIQGHGFTAHNVIVTGFSSRGVSIDTGTVGNANNCHLDTVRSQGNGGDGFYINGVNSQSMTLTNCDASGNTGWGFNTGNSAHNTHIGLHCDANAGGAVQDAGNSSHYYNPYVEGTTASVVTLSGPNLLWVGAVYGDPTTFTASANSVVIRNGRFEQVLSVGDRNAGGHTYALVSGSYGVGCLSLSDLTGSRNVFNVDSAGTRLQINTALDVSIAGISGAVQLVNPGTTTTAPTAGAAGALPATPAGYVTITIAGTARKLPYY